MYTKKEKIDFNIYNKENILNSIEAFKEISNIRLEDDYLFVTEDEESDLDEVFNEFMNYVISNINEQ